MPVGRRAGLSAAWALRALAVGALLSLLFAGPALEDSYVLTLAVEAVFAAMVAVGVGFLLHQTGLVSFGHAAFYGSGAYTLALLLERTSLDPLAAVILSWMAGTALAALIGIVAIRVPGIGFAMLTLAFGQAIHTFALKSKFTGGFDGIVVETPETIAGLDASIFQQTESFWPIAWGALLLSLLGLYLLSRSSLGRLLIAIRENEERARFLGYRTYLPRVVAFTASGSVAALAGTLYALHRSFVSPQALSFTRSGDALIQALLGGTESLAGPVVGSFAYVLLRDQLTSYTSRWLLVVGLLFIAVVIFLPRGLIGAAKQLAETVRRLVGHAARNS